MMLPLMPAQVAFKGRAGQEMYLEAVKIFPQSFMRVTLDTSLDPSVPQAGQQEILLFSTVLPAYELCR